MQARSLMHPLDTGTVNLCDVSWKHHTHFYCLGTAPGLNYCAVALGRMSLVQKKQTEGGSAQILLGQSIQKKKEGIFGKPAWVAPELPCPKRSALALT